MIRSSLWAICSEDVGPPRKQGFVLSFDTEQIIVGALLDIPGLDLEKDRERVSVEEALFTDIIGD